MSVSSIGVWQFSVLPSWQTTTRMVGDRASVSRVTIFSRTVKRVSRRHASWREAKDSAGGDGRFYIVFRVSVHDGVRAGLQH